MKRMSWRAAVLLILGVLIAVISAGCTLSGATQAPPPETSAVGPSSVTEEPLATTQAPIIASPTKLIVVGSPTPVATFDTFATLTAGPQTSPGIGVGVAAVVVDEPVPQPGIFRIVPTMITFALAIPLAAASWATVRLKRSAMRYRLSPDWTV